MNEPKNLDNLPWYKNHILLLIIFIPCAAVIAGLSTLFIAINATYSEVLPSYYKQGVSPGQNNRSTFEAQRLGLEASIFNQQLVIVGDFNALEPLNFYLSHPTVDAQDLSYRLQLKNPDEAGVYTVPDEVFEQLKQHKWYLELRPLDNSWLLKGTATLDMDRYHLTPHG